MNERHKPMPGGAGRAAPARRFRGICAAAYIAGLLFCSTMAHGQLGDPTRPPNGVDSGGTVADAGAPVLQSIMISGTRRSAIIGGQLVELGQKYGEAKLVRITEGEVTLAQGGETTVLHLFPGIEKKTTAEAGPPAKRAVVRKKAKTRGADATR